MTTTDSVHNHDPVVVDQRNAVSTITINRPGRRNALNAPVKTALRDALGAVAVDDSVRAVVLTGAGEHFCAGQDLAEHAALLAEYPGHAFDTVEQHYSPIVRSLTTMAKPVIAAVEGTCVGAGLGFALACDLRVVSTDAVLSTAFSSIGLTCDSGLAHTLPRAIGAARAQELVLLGEPVTGEQADRLGLVTRPVAPGKALEVATELAARLAAGPTRAYAESKLLLAETYERTLDQTLAQEGRAQARAGSTTDHHAAVVAFLSKETPEFGGR
jgi:2-(1,2-epoxy-1,2-dihydrophenyl)acetyl-CoA isomerase